MANAKLHLNGADYDLPVIEGTEGEIGLDIAALRGASGAITFDPGYGNTGSCKSSITFIDGEKGILRHRGYAIEDLAAKSSFVEVAYLLMNGDLPNPEQRKSFEQHIEANSTIPETIKNILAQFPKTAHPMNPFASALAALSSCYAEWNDDDAVELNSWRLIGQCATIAAHFHRLAKGEAPVASDPKRSYCANFLHMMFGEKSVTPELESALNMLLIVHADHEQNCSTSAVRMVGSSQANIFASIAAGACALWGPLHGGANQAVIEMLEHIAADGGDYAKYMEMAKDKNSGFRLMGFGHRVYKNFDPRATILKGACDSVLAKLGVTDPMLDIAKGLEAVALSDDYFIARNLYPNVDFYSGILYKAMGIPVNFFTVMFAIGRMPGWLAHWREQFDEGRKIHRPRQIYTGKTLRKFPR